MSAPHKQKPSRGTIRTGSRSKSPAQEEALLDRVLEIVERARGHVARSANTVMLQSYWLIGREIVEVEQQGAKRADYGARVIERLAARLS